MSKIRAAKLLGPALLLAVAATQLQAEDHTNNVCEGGFRGVANLDQSVVLTPTTNAPAGAKGLAEFIAVNDNGTNYEALFVKTVGLTNGTFTVSVTDDTGTNTYALGALNVTTRTNSGDRCGSARWRPRERGCWGYENDDGQGDNGGAGGFPWWGGGACPPLVSWTNWVKQCDSTHPAWTNLLNLGACTNLFSFATNTCHWYTNTLTVGSGSFILPPGLAQTNAAQVTIADAGGVVYLTGDLTGLTNTTVCYNETASVVPGTATNAQGSATLAYRLVRGRTLGTFRLQVSGLPPHTKLFLTANGGHPIPMFTRGDGTLVIRALGHVKLSTLTSLVAMDNSGNVVFSVSF